MNQDKVGNSRLTCWGTKHLCTSNVETQYYKADRFLLSCWGTKHLDFRALKRNNTTQIPSSCHAEARSILDFQASRLNITKQIASSCHTEAWSILHFQALRRNINKQIAFFLSCWGTKHPTLQMLRCNRQKYGVEAPAFRFNTDAMF